MTNAEQTTVPIEEIWRRYDAIESRLSAPLSERMLELAELRPDMRVLDLATGRGEPALRAARRVGPRGGVVGVDLSATLLKMARKKADDEGLSNLDLRVGDAEALTELPPHHFHAVTCRWGLMYMSAPITALENARRALLPSGALVAALWAEPERCSFYALPRRCLHRYLQIPTPDQTVPGTFRFAALERTVSDFERAGFAVDHVEELEVPVFEAATGAEVVAWAKALGCGLSRLLDEVSDEDQRTWEHDFMSELEPCRVNGLLRLSGVTRIVRARPA